MSCRCQSCLALLRPSLVRPDCPARSQLGRRRRRQSVQCDCGHQHCGALARHTGRPAVWRACGLSGATVRDALQRLVPSLAPEPADLVIVAFGVNDATSYRSPSAFADDLTELVTAARNRVGDAAVVVGGVAPSSAFRRCLGRCEASWAGALLRCRRRPIGLRDGCQGSLSSGFQRR